MKVKDLVPGMILKPVCNSSQFISAFNDKVLKVGYGLRIQPGRWVDAVLGRTAIYLGQRRDLGIEKKSDADWSNRFVLIESKIYPVDSVDWWKIEPVEEK